MKKQICVIKIHSFVSEITNSSTELFVCDTDKEIEIVKEILQRILDGYNMMEQTSYTMDVFKEPFRVNLEEYKKWKKEDDAKRKKCEKTKDWNEYWNDRSPYGTIAGWFIDDEDAEEIKKIRTDIIRNGYEERDFCGYNRVKEYEERINKACRSINDWKGKSELIKKEVAKIYKEIEKEIKNGGDKPMWWDAPWKYSSYNFGLVKNLDGCIILVGTRDNSIPYDIWDAINRQLNGHNYYLG